MEWPSRIWQEGKHGWVSREPNPKELAEREFVEAYWRDNGNPPKGRDPEEHAKAFIAGQRT